MCVPEGVEKETIDIKADCDRQPKRQSITPKETDQRFNYSSML